MWSAEYERERRRMDIGRVQGSSVHAGWAGCSHLMGERLVGPLAAVVGDVCGSSGRRRRGSSQGGFRACHLEHRPGFRALHTCQVRRGRGISVRKAWEREKVRAGRDWQASQRRALKSTCATAAIATCKFAKFCIRFTQVRCRDFILSRRAHNICFR